MVCNVCVVYHVYYVCLICLVCLICASSKSYSRLPRHGHPYTKLEYHFCDALHLFLNPCLLKSLSWNCAFELTLPSFAAVPRGPWSPMSLHWSEPSIPSTLAAVPTRFLFFNQALTKLPKCQNQRPQEFRLAKPPTQMAHRWQSIRR